MWSKFKGTGVAIVTPFGKDLTVDYQGLGNLVDHLINGGVDYLVVQGTTGESATLTNKEKASVLNFVYERVAGKIPLVMGIGGNNTAAVAEAFQTFDTDKFEAILSVCPYYNKPNQEGLYQHYKYLSERSPKPIILYNVPGRTSCNLTAATTLRLAHDFNNLIAIKEASGNLDQIGKIIKDRPDNFLVISGDDALTVPMISIGANGVISVVANAFPVQFTKMVNAALKPDFLTAQKLHLSLIEITELMFREGNPAGVKAALEILKVSGKEVRLPLVSLSGSLYKEMEQAINKLP